MRHRLYYIKEWFLHLFIYPAIARQELDYDEYWRRKKVGQLGEPNSFQTIRGNWISQRIELNSSVADIGCGDGSVLFAIKKNISIQAIGLDVSPVVLEFLASKDIQTVKFDLLDPQCLDKLPKVDHALILEVLEHMPRPEEFLLSVLNQVDRSVFISVPNTGFIQHRLRLLFGKFPLQWRSHPSEHLRFWTFDDFIWWLKVLQLENSTIVYCYAGIPILNKLWPSLFAEGIIAQIKK